MWVPAAFIALGFLIGNLVGLTAQSVTGSVLALLFAFGGGSAITFFQKLDRDGLRSASQAILALSLSCLVGVYAGVIVSEHQLLTPNEYTPSTRSSIADHKYLRSGAISMAHSIDQRYANGDMGSEDAYQKLYDVFNKLEISVHSVSLRYRNGEIGLQEAFEKLGLSVLGEDK